MNWLPLLRGELKNWLWVEVACNNPEAAVRMALRGQLHLRFILSAREFGPSVPHVLEDGFLLRMIFCREGLCRIEQLYLCLLPLSEIGPLSM